MARTNHCRICGCVIPQRTEDQLLCKECNGVKDKDVGHVTGTCCGEKYWFNIKPEIHYRYEWDGTLAALKYPTSMKGFCQKCNKRIFDTPVYNDGDDLGNKGSDRSSNVMIYTQR